METSDGTEQDPVSELIACKAVFVGSRGSEERCQPALQGARWPQILVCPSCSHQHEPMRLRARALLQCCPQTSLTALTIVASTKLPLTRWWLAMLLAGAAEKGISTLGLKRHLGVSYLTAWRVKHRLLRVMKERNEEDHPVGLRLGKGAGFRKAEVQRFAKRHFDPDATSAPVLAQPC